MSSDFVEIIEVSPRDGIQNEAVALSTADKLTLIGMAVDAGAGRVEATSFVNPRRVPQMADADDVAAALPRGTGRMIGLTLNRRGFDRAVASGLDEANCVVVASETFNQRNQGAPTFETVKTIGEVAALGAPIRIGVTIAAAFGCPFEGEVPLPRLLHVAEACVAAASDAGTDLIEIALADTIGVAAPCDVTERVGAIRRAFPALSVRLHLHNTRNTGVANAWAGLEAGARSLDASFGGVGGCPFAPRATGNVPTEDLLYMLDRSGVRTGMNLDKAIAAAEWLQGKLGKQSPGMVMKAGGFPAPRAA